MNPRFTLRLLAACALGLAGSALVHASSSAPKPVGQQAPLYDFELRKEQVEGAVLVSYTVRTDGSVSDARVVSSTSHVFEAPVLSAVSNWRYEPALRDGKPVESRVEQLVTFTVPEKNPQTSTDTLVAALKPRDGDSS